MALGKQTNLVDDALKFQSNESDLNNTAELPVEDADVEIAPHGNAFFNPALLNWNWDDVIVIPSDDDVDDAYQPIDLPAQNPNVELAPHGNAFYNPTLLNWNWDDVIVIPSDDDEAANVENAPQVNPFFNPDLPNWNWDDVIVIPSDDDEPDADVEAPQNVNVIGRKRVYALIDESDSDEEPYWSNAFFF